MTKASREQILKELEANRDSWSETLTMMRDLIIKETNPEMSRNVHFPAYNMIYREYERQNIDALRYWIWMGKPWWKRILTRA